MSAKNVKFSKDSDTSGSRTSSHASSHVSSRTSHKSAKGHRRSDSESLSDYDSRGPVPEGAFSSNNYAHQRLQEALHLACAEREEWKVKAHDLDEALIKADKKYNQLEARERATDNRNENLEQEHNKLLSEKKALQDENAQLKSALERLEKKLNRASGPPPSMSAPIQDNSEKASRPKVHRSSSRSARDAPRERALSEAEQAEKDKARWSKRFERSDESSTDGSTSKTSSERRRRRESTTYIEPMGPPAARPAHAPVPPSPTRHFPTYTTSPAYAPQYASVREPVMSSVPRIVKSPPKHGSAIRPSVLVQSPRYDNSPFHPEEDGGYFPHPLPRGGR